ncbi:hypothetical protein RB195_007869 [Necator americanus]|uniref:Uncharacterized protein n=1 Tax=Necator americanus TaxID=51031 RepID=A0ABR1C1Z0_NECAM
MRPLPARRSVAGSSDITAATACRPAPPPPAATATAAAAVAAAAAGNSSCRRGGGAAIDVTLPYISPERNSPTISFFE